MSALGFALVLAAAFCHATWNFFVKRINAGAELVWLFSACSVILYLPLAIYIAWGWQQLSPAQAIFMAGSTVLHSCYFLLLQLAYKKGDLSIIYPTARASGPLLSVAMAVLLLGETLSLQAGIGGAVIIFGILMLTGQFGRQRRAALTPLAFGLTTGFLIGSYTVWDAYAVSILLIPPLLLDYVANLGRAILLSPLAWRRRQAVVTLWNTHRLGILAIAIFSPLAYILVLIALQFTPVVFVAPIRELSVLITVLLGSILLGEGNLKHRLTWAAVILLGTTILAASE